MICHKKKLALHPYIIKIWECVDKLNLADSATLPLFDHFCFVGKTNK